MLLHRLYRSFCVAVCSIATLSALAALSLPAQEPASAGLPKRHIVLLRDGPSWYFDDFADRTVEELKSLAVGSYDLTIEDFNARWDSEKLNEAMDRALSEEKTDLVLAAGFLATELGLSMADEERKRPVLGGAVEFSESLDAAISVGGGSKIANYTFITDPQRVAADIAALKRLSGTPVIHAILDREILNRMKVSKDLDQIQSEIEGRLGITLHLLPVGKTADSILAAIPRSAKAIYVSVLPKVGPDQRENLFEKMARRGLFSLSIVGASDVRLGATAGLAPGNSDAIAKRAALNAHQILLGIDPQTLPVYLPVEDRLLINRRTANLAGWSPNYETALTAEFLDDGEGERGALLTLETALSLAADENVEVLVQREAEAIARRDFDATRSLQRPQVDLNLQQGITDYTDRINPALTPDRLEAGRFGVQLRQVLFNDTIRSNVNAAREAITVEKLGTKSRQLDAMESAGVAFLNYLAARALWQIQRENLRLSENNLRLARLRVDIGASEVSETYRWEQDAALNRASVFQLEADRKNARIELNRLMGQPREKQWRFVDIDLDDEETYFMNNILSRYLRVENDVEKFGEFLRRIAVPASPELAAFDYGLIAQGIQLGRVERSFFLPEFSAVLGYDRVGQGTELFDYTTQGEASAGVALTFPIFEGGLRKAELGGQRAIIRQLAAQRENSLQLIEQRALVSLNEITSEYPNIRLSRVGLTAARKNYEAVQEKYSQGSARILDLLDAQSSLLRQRQQASLAVYSYLIAIVQMQRAVAWFEHEKSPAEKQQWERMFATYMNHGRLELPGAFIAADTADSARERAELVSSAAEVPESGKPTLRATPIVEKPEVSEPDKPGFLNRIFQKSNP